MKEGVRHSCNTALLGVGFWAQLCIVLCVRGWAYVLCGLVVPCTWGWEYIGVLCGAAVFCIDDWQGYMGVGALSFPVSCFHLPLRYAKLGPGLCGLGSSFRVLWAWGCLFV